MLLISVLLFLPSIWFVEAEDVLVTTPNGKIKGRKEYSLRGISFFAFQHIPFAKPPIGQLRFQDPQPFGKWEGTLDASKNKEVLCFQQTNPYRVQNLTAVENEDCLYLNVYTPLQPSIKTALPVMVYFYGGGFVEGGGDFDFFGPHYLMENGVMVVTFNYRVSAFGFLSTGDTVIPGNFGLKDQLLALQWVKNNIRYFGGDPNKVTIFGQSAGGAGVTYHLMSKKSTGLFRAAIAQSGSILCPWAYQRDHKTIAYDVATSLKPGFDRASSSQALLTFLRSVSAKDLNDAANDFKQHTGNEQIVQGFRFTPVIEPQHENAFITESMYSALENGHMNRVPLMLGICSEESIARATLATFKGSVAAYEADLSKLVNNNMHLDDVNRKRIVGNAIRNIYTKGLLQNDLGKAVRYFSDMSFNRALIRHAEMQSKFSNVYFYQFSYHGALGGNRPSLPGAYNVGHAEDNRYLWALANHTYLNKYPASDILTSNRYRALFTNFAKYLNPTPQAEALLEKIIWPKVEPNNFLYLDINATLSIKKNPKGDVYPKWVAIYEKATRKPYDTF